MTAVSPIKAGPEPAANAILTLNNIEVVYDRVILVLKGVSLAVPNRGPSSWLPPAQQSISPATQGESDDDCCHFDDGRAGSGN